MEQQSCISNQLWIGYSNKTLNQTETDMVLSHVGTCELCADIKEGIDALKQPESLNQRVENINESVDSFLQPKRNYRLFWYWSAAAILVFGIGLSWFFISNEQQIADRNNRPLKVKGIETEKPEFPNETNPIISKPGLNDIPLASNTNPVFKPEGSMDYKHKEEINIKDGYSDGLGLKRMDDAIQFKNIESKNLTDTSKKITKLDSISRGVTWAFDNVASGTYSSPTNAEISTIEMKKAGSEDIVVGENDDLKKDKTFAIATRKSAANPAPMNNSTNNSNYSNNYSFTTYFYAKDSANMVLAKGNYNLNNFAKAIENIKAITANPASLFYEEALLLKAKALIKLKKINEAKVTLKTIIALQMDRKSEAEILLKSLK